ncbi:MAG: winged helix DNA-binding domain-containing protein [Candidatus Limnocylindrales bacterium]|nr:winged helix DNA-binding domain-containing protein [Candidatus Limnocylindrales bacterium]
MPSTSFIPAGRRLTALRLVSQRIGVSGLSTPGDVVRWMLAMQAQDLPGAKWSVGLRASQTREAAVDASFDSGEIVRSWPMRGTLHLVPAEDLGWMLQLTAPRALRSAASRRAALGIIEADIERARAIVVASLTGGRALTRAAILASIAGGGVSTAGQRGYHLLWYLAQTGTLVLGAAEGRQQTFALLDEWVRAPRRLDRDEALGELAYRYFRSHGPATGRDLVRWSGLTMADVERGIAVNGNLLTSLELDGVRHLLAPEALAQAPAAGRVHLLPGFDEYLLGYQDRTAALASEHSAAVVPGGNGMFRPTVVADGEVVGTWRRTLKAGEVVIEPQLWGPLPSELRDPLVEATGAYGAFLGRPARLA